MRSMQKDVIEHAMESGDPAIADKAFREIDVRPAQISDEYGSLTPRAERIRDFVMAASAG
jgi:hypothetical protein